MNRWIALALLALAFGSPRFVSAQTQEVEVNANVISSVSSTNSTFVANPTQVSADGVATSTLTATILDENSQPLPNKPVEITSSRGPVVDLIRCYDGLVLTTLSSATTNAEGKVVCVVSSATIGLSAYTATAEGIELEDKPEVNFIKPATPPGGTEEPPGGGSEPPGIIEQIIEEIGEALDSVSPIVPGGLGAAVLIPTVALLVPLGSSISASVLAGIPALQYLFFSSLPWFRPPRRWGTVRDKTTKVPIPGIFVDLMAYPAGQQVKRIMTDRTGRFGFLRPEKGKFWVEIKNPLYEPFRTEAFDVAKFGDKPISFDIDLMPLETARVEALRKTARYMHFLAAVQIIQLIFLIGGSLLSIGLFIRAQSTENILLLILYSLLWALRFISSLSYSQSGHIVERQTDNAVNEAVVQVTSTKKGETQFIHSTITDEAGRFLVLVPPGEYAVIAAKQGYEPSETQVKGEIANIEMNMDRSPEVSTEPPPVVPSTPNPTPAT